MLKKYISCFFLFVLVTTLTMTLVIADQPYSYNENKYLSQKPNLTWEQIKTGHYMKGWHQYLNDQLFMRENWIQIRTQ